MTQSLSLHKFKAAMKIITNKLIDTIYFPDDYKSKTHTCISPHLEAMTNSLLTAMSVLCFRMKTDKKITLRLNC